MLCHAGSAENKIGSCHTEQIDVVTEGLLKNATRLSVSIWFFQNNNLPETLPFRCNKPIQEFVNVLLLTSPG